MTKNKYKFNIIDFSVILIIVVAIVGFGVRFGLSQKKTIKSDVKFRYVLKVENVRHYTTDALKQSNLLTDLKCELDMGKITNIELEDATSHTSLSNGKLVTAKIPERYNCYITIEAEGSEFENKYMLLDETELAVGRIIPINTKFVQTSGTVKSIEILQ